SNAKGSVTGGPSFKITSIVTDNPEPTATTNAQPNPPAETPKTVAAKHVSEADLRAAAIVLPQAEVPVAFELAGQNRRVEVQLVVDEAGNVVNARGMSAEPQLNEAAEAAAKKAKFTPTKLTSEPSQVFGSIYYDFVSVPMAKPEASKTTAANTSSQPLNN